MTELSTKPYLIRAIYEWCADSGYTPYIGVHVDQNTRVPMEFVKNGEIVLSISMQATRDLTIGNDMVHFSARFGGVSREIAVPIYAIASIFARENGKGMFFEREAAPAHTPAAIPALAAVLSPLAAAPTGDDAITATTPPQLQSVPTPSLATQANERQKFSADHSDVTADVGVDGGVDDLDSNRNQAASSSKSRTDKPGTDKPGNKPKGPPRGKLRVIK